MTTSPGPSRFTFDDTTGALLVTSSGGGGSNVNITGINGSAPALSNPLAVELSDGTNALGTNTNPLKATGPASNTASAPAQTAVANTSGLILAANANRIEAIIVNTGTTPIYLAFGQTPSATAYHVALAGCTSANDGTGGTYITDSWKGAINAIAGTSGTVCVTELTP